MDKYFYNLVKTSLICVYLVIVAGAIVRMTGSGMGCPDWPKCFGYYIPPTEESQLLFKSNTEYKKGMMILLENEAFLVAKKDFISSNKFNESDWEIYSKHNYVSYDPVHTWVEFINRLIGAIAGLPILIFTIISIYYWKRFKNHQSISVLIVLSMGFQAWLGKTVVDSNLAPYKITIHMLMALVIVGLLLSLLIKNKKVINTTNKIFTFLTIVSLVFTLIQIVLGTQVREFVDEQVKLIGYDKTNWLTGVPLRFYIHRTFSLLVLAVNIYLFYINSKFKLGFNKINLVIFLIGVEIITGIFMYYFDFPFLTQPIHLVIATLLFGAQFYILLECIKRKKNDL